MQILLASAKTMREYCEYTGLPLSEPRFRKTAEMFAEELGHMDAVTISELFSCSLKIGELNKERFRILGTYEAEIMPAILAYNGQAYRHLKADSFTPDELLWADRHLWISSLLYGLLRPMDGINTYRMEGGFGLKSTGGKKVYEYWRPLLTDLLIESVIADDGVLVYLDTEEYRHILDWKRVVAKLPMILEPEFHVLKGGKLTTQAVWSKSCRGAMTRYIIENRITDPAELESFAYCGFRYVGNDGGHLQFVRNDKQV